MAEACTIILTRERLPVGVGKLQFCSISRAQARQGEFASYRHLIMGHAKILITIKSPDTARAKSILWRRRRGPPFSDPAFEMRGY